MAFISKTVSVDSFGAKGDGTTDDTSAITAALAAAGAGGTVQFTAGKTYKTISVIAIPSDRMTLLGYGAIITSATASQYSKFTFTSRTGGAIYGLTFNLLAVSSTLDNAGVITLESSSDITIRDCAINQCQAHGVRISGNCTRLNIENNSFYQFFVGVLMDDDLTDDPTRVKITGNRFRTGWGSTSTNYSGAIKISSLGSVPIHGHIISHNSIDAAGQMGIEMQGSVSGCVISENVIKGTGFGISVAQSCARTAVTGNTISNVDVYGIEVAGAIDTSLTGNTIYNTGGSYGIIVVDGAMRTSISGGTIVGGQYGIYTDCGNVVITGVSFYGQLGNTINVHNGSNVSINDNHMAANANLFSFIALDATDYPVGRITLDSNRFTTTGGTINCAVHLYSPNSNPITDLLVTNNTTQLCSFAAGAYNIGVNNAHTGLLRVRTINNICSGRPDDYNSFNVPTFSNDTSRSFVAFNYGYIYYDGAVINNNANGGLINFQIPPAAGLGGYTMTHVKTDSSSNPVLISGYNSTIQGLASVALTSQYSRMTLVADGNSNWAITSSGKS